MRRRFLLESVRRNLGRDEEPLEVAVMWQRHHWMVPFALAAALAVGLGAAVVGFTGPSAVAVGVAAAAVAATATTEYRVLVRTDAGLRLLRASRIRQVATGLVEQLPDDAVVELVANQFVVTEWLVDGRRYTVGKSSEAAMTRIATAT
jgi:hypothetical protein